MNSDTELLQQQQQQQQHGNLLHHHHHQQQQQQHDHHPHHHQQQQQSHDGAADGTPLSKPYFPGSEAADTTTATTTTTTTTTHHNLVTTTTTNHLAGGRKRKPESSTHHASHHHRNNNNNNRVAATDQLSQKQAKTSLQHTSPSRSHSRVAPSSSSHNNNNNNSTTLQQQQQQQQQQHPQAPQQQQPHEAAFAPHHSPGKGGGGMHMSASVTLSEHTAAQPPQQHSSNNNHLNNDHPGTTTNVTASSSVEQPEGWRVKLYRLNPDGSWDDCGTGRIVCLYRSPNNNNNNNNTSANATTEASKETPATANTNTNTTMDSNNNINNSIPTTANDSGNHPTTTTTTLDESSATTTTSMSGDSNSPPPTTTTTTTPPTSSSSSPSPAQSLDQWLYQETGEATLCVQAEISKHNRQPRVLLRTRILLRDAYQRQGDNIITWCEPYYGGGKDKNAPLPLYHQTQINNNNNNNNNPSGGVDLALSFQDNAGCLDIWGQITHVQSRAAELILGLNHANNNNSNSNNSNGTGAGGKPEDSSLQHIAASIAAEHHAQLKQQQQQQQQHDHHQRGGNNGGGMNDMIVVPANGLWNHRQQGGMDSHLASSHHLHHSEEGPSPSTIPDEYVVMGQKQHWHLPDPPTLHNLPQIADTIAALQHAQQRETMALRIGKDDCSYLKALIGLFDASEKVNDYGKLACLAACVKSILLLNEPQILELVVGEADIFERVCSCLEYDPDLREKANHRWFLRERARFRTVLPMENPELVSAIHRSFRVQYMRDSLLRPTMDEGSLSTLNSIQTFSHADVVKGVTMSPCGQEVALAESYLVRVIRMLGMELHSLCTAEWMDFERLYCGGAVGIDVDEAKFFRRGDHSPHRSRVNFRDPSATAGGHSATWRQYLVPQDGSMESRRLRRRGCIFFLRELFNMVRLSLLQNDKDDFFSVICTLDVELYEDEAVSSPTAAATDLGSSSTVRSTSDPPPVRNTSAIPPPLSNSVPLLSLLGNVLADCNADVTEKGAALEIIVGVVMHDPSFVRRHCLDFHRGGYDKASLTGRPDPNESKQVVFVVPPNDLMSALLFLLDVETDAGILLQVSEIMKVVLDTDIVTDSASGLFKGDADGMSQPGHGHEHGHLSQGASNDQNQFFSIFYEHYMAWLVAPFQFTLLHAVRPIPEYALRNPSDSTLVKSMMDDWKNGVQPGNKLLCTVPFCPTRSSFAVELLSFCVRAHLYRMKFFLLKSRVLGSVLSLLRPKELIPRLVVDQTGSRCLKLAALRFLRSILSVHDEFYHRHIIQHDLFAPVFETLRENPVGDNLVSSAIVEMCDYIHNEKIKSLVEYIVTRHLSVQPMSDEVPRLEDVSSPYVTTLTTLRKAYEENKQIGQHHHGAHHNRHQLEAGLNTGQTSPGGSRYFPPTGNSTHSANSNNPSPAPQLHAVPRVLTGKALEDQRKFQEADEEEAYFESSSPSSTDSAGSPKTMDPISAMEPLSAAASAASNELHRTPRMFSFPQQQQQQQQQQLQLGDGDQNKAPGTNTNSVDPPNGEG